jgi:hypothetical protein
MNDEMGLGFYSKHGILTDPQDFVVYSFLEQQLENVEQICESISLLVLNDFLYTMRCFHIPDSSLGDINIRSVKEKLEKINQRIQSNECKNENDRYSLGNCRDISLIICATLRHKAIPARLRSGFATFFNPIKKFDHWICEYWNDEKKCWERIDGWMYQIKKAINKLPNEYSEGFSALDLDPLHLDPKFFLTGSEAWRKCRNGEDDFKNYGTYQEGLDGEWFVRDNMIRDIFCLNKIEPLPWDCWGTMGKQNNRIDEPEHLLLDKMASALSVGDVSLKVLHEFSILLKEQEFPSI